MITMKKYRFQEYLISLSSFLWLSFSWRVIHQAIKHFFSARYRKEKVLRKKSIQFFSWNESTWDERNFQPQCMINWNHANKWVATKEDYSTSSERLPLFSREVWKWWRNLFAREFFRPFWRNNLSIRVLGTFILSEMYSYDRIASTTTQQV